MSTSTTEVVTLYELRASESRRISRTLRIRAAIQRACMDLGWEFYEVYSQSPEGTARKVEVGR